MPCPASLTHNLLNPTPSSTARWRLGWNLLLLEVVAEAAVVAVAAPHRLPKRPVRNPNPTSTLLSPWMM
jgi:hypothetical protein